MDGRVVRLTTGKLRTLLAVLAMTPGQTVSLERLTAAVWADDPPANPRRSLQTYAGRLRAELGDKVITSQHAGLALMVDPDAVDAVRFEHLATDAARQPTPDHERQLLGQALHLWRGEPFEGITSGWLEEIEAPRLVERRLTAFERAIDLDLAAGRHDDLVGELSQWTARHPMRESLWVRLLITLDRCGRRADALDRYHQIRIRIADELGVDPSPDLQHVYANLLADRPAHTGLAHTGPGQAGPTQAGPRQAGPASAAEPPAQVAVPQQLPGPPPAFIGRATELAQLDTITDGSAVVITAIDGMAGVGKTALAVHAARHLASRYPDGQLFLDLHGFTEGVAPVDPNDALDRMLRSLGVPGDQIPPQLDDRAALYRSRLADQRILILLDNAATETQVRPLLPGSPGCLVLITSRRRLTGLDQTHAISLDALPPAEAVDLFTKTVGTDQAGDTNHQTLIELVELCGRLPLALRIAAARLRARRTWTLQHLIDRLHDRQQRLAELEAGQRSVIAALDLSYQQLTTDQQRTYRLLSIHPGPDIDHHAATALLDTSPHHTRRLLDQLLDAHLLQELTPIRYQFHDLTRQHAALTASRDEPETTRNAALDRLLTHYATTAATAMNTAYPFEQERRPPPPKNPHPSAHITTPEHATTWLDTELPNLLATTKHALEHNRPDYPPLLAATLDRHLTSRSLTSDAEALHQLALGAARTVGDTVAEIKALVCLGLSYRRTGHHAQAEANYQRVLQLTPDHEYRVGELDALIGLGQIQRLQCRFGDATDSFGRALAIAETIDYPTGELQALLGLGHVYRTLRKYELARNYLHQGLALARDIGHRVGEMGALIGLGWTHLASDHNDQAVEEFDRALQVARSEGHRIGELATLIGIADVQRNQRRYEAAGDLYEHVLVQARLLGKPNWVFEALQGVGRVKLSQDMPDEAVDHHREALAIAEEMAQPSDIARAHDGLAHAYRTLQQHDEARQHWRQALNIYTELGIDSTSEDSESSATAIRGHLAGYDD